MNTPPEPPADYEAQRAELVPKRSRSQEIDLLAIQ